MINMTYLSIIIIFILYYLFVLIFERKMIHDATNIIEKFLAVLLGYVGIALIYFSVTGKPFLGNDVTDYSVYIFIIGFISVVWAVPTLLSEFRFFKRFMKKKKK